jgi:hypothetical protein
VIASKVHTSSTSSKSNLTLRNGGAKFKYAHADTLRSKDFVPEWPPL